MRAGAVGERGRARGRAAPLRARKGRHGPLPHAGGLPGPRGGRRAAAIVVGVGVGVLVAGGCEEPLVQLSPAHGRLAPVPPVNSRPVLLGPGPGPASRDGGAEGHLRAGVQGGRHLRDLVADVDHLLGRVGVHEQLHRREGRVVLPESPLGDLETRGARLDDVQSSIDEAAVEQVPHQRHGLACQLALSRVAVGARAARRRAKPRDVCEGGGQLALPCDARGLELRREVRPAGHARGSARTEGGQEREQAVPKMLRGLPWELGWEIVDCEDHNGALPPRHRPRPPLPRGWVVAIERGVDRRGLGREVDAASGHVAGHVGDGLEAQVARGPHGQEIRPGEEHGETGVPIDAVDEHLYVGEHPLCQRGAVEVRAVVVLPFAHRAAAVPRHHLLRTNLDDVDLAAVGRVSSALVEGRQVLW
mmetsp:Transcript_5128/g.16752  ORF Transcript_5128/g.16752 Transcript_5128/m.16752 type:complete len:418 (+) Transcript_5128:1429-2682(+)